MQGLEVTVCTADNPDAELKHSNFRQVLLRCQTIGGGVGTWVWLSGLEEAIAGADVVVAPQELACLTVPYLWVRRKRLCKTWIWWGHGYNCQASAHPSLATSVKEGVKRFLTKRGDGLITYTPQAAEYWRRRGFPAERVQAFYNTIDVEGLRRARALICGDELDAIRSSLRLTDKQVLLFSGRLYADKNVDFLLRAFAQLKERRPQVSLLIIGDGAERTRLEALSAKLALSDVHFLGEIVTDEGAAPYFALADVLALPSYVGLAIVHGFAFGLPIVTTEAPGHGPEIEYLSQNTGIMTKFKTSEYAHALDTLLSDTQRLATMKRETLHQAQHLELGRAVSRFLDAVTTFASSQALTETRGLE